MAVIAAEQQARITQPFNPLLLDRPTASWGIEGPHLGRFSEAAHEATFQTTTSLVNITKSAPLFRGSQSASHRYAEIIDQATGQRLMVDIITTGESATQFQHSQSEMSLHGFDRIRRSLFKGKPEEPTRQPLAIVVETEGHRLLNSGSNAAFDRHLDTFQGTTFVVRHAMRLGPKGNEMVTPDEFPEPKVAARALADLGGLLGMPLSRAERRRLEQIIPDTRAQLRKQPLMELPGGFAVYEPHTVMHETEYIDATGRTRKSSLPLRVYPVLLSRLTSEGTVGRDYFELVTLRPLEDLQHEEQLMVGMESLCTCMTGGSKGDDCFAQVDFRIDSSIIEAERRGMAGVMVYAHGQTDLGFGELSRLIVDRNRAHTIDQETGLPAMDTEEARELSEVHTIVDDIRSHDDSAMIIHGAFPGLRKVIVPTNNADKLHALSQRVATERIPAKHDPSLLHEAVIQQAEKRRGKQVITVAA